jgi:hypothetical protein
MSIADLFDRRAPCWSDVFVVWATMLLVETVVRTRRRKMRPIEIACRHVDVWPVVRNCAAQAGEPCEWGLEGDGATLDYAPPEFHAERIEDAAAMGDIS